MVRVDPKRKLLNNKWCWRFKIQGNTGSFHSCSNGVISLTGRSSDASISRDMETGVRFMKGLACDSGKPGTK